MPAIVRGLGADRLGLLQLAWVLIGTFGLFDLGLGRATTRLVATRTSEGRAAEVPGVVLTVLGALLALGLASGVLFAALVPWLAGRALRVPGQLAGEARAALLVLAASVPLVVVTSGLRGVLEARQSFGALAAMRIGLGLVTFLGPLCVLPFSSSLVPIVAVLAAGRLLALVLHALLCRDLLRARGAATTSSFEWRILPEVVRYGGWLTVSTLVGPILVFLDRFLIGALVSVRALAYYATPLDMVQRVSVIPTAVGVVLFPAVAAVTQGRDERGRLRELLSLGLRLCPVAVFPPLLVLSVLAPELLGLWLGPEFAREGTPIVRIVAVALLLNGLGTAAILFLQAAGRPDLPARLHLVELVLYVPLLAWLAASHGLLGAAAAWSIRVAGDAIALVVAAHAMVAVERRDLARIAVVTAAALAALVGLPILDGLGAKLVACAVAGVVLPLAAFAWLATPAERAGLRRALGRRG